MTIEDLVRFVGKALKKGVIQPMVYKRGSDYDAERYWGDRLAKYGIDNLKGPGDEGLSHEDNYAYYIKESQKFLERLRALVPNRLNNLSVLEIGTGTGFYTDLMFQEGVSDLTGLDITDVFFEDFRRRFSNFKFLKGDVATSELPQRYDVILMFDVLEHIVTKEKLAKTLENIANTLKPGGVFFLTGFYLNRKSRDYIFYNKIWSLMDITPHLGALTVEGEILPYRDNYLATFRKPLA